MGQTRELVPRKQRRRLLLGPVSPAEGPRAEDERKALSSGPRMPEMSAGDE